VSGMSCMSPYMSAADKSFNVLLSWLFVVLANLMAPDMLPQAYLFQLLLAAVPDGAAGRGEEQEGEEREEGAGV
jgi:hypothetical protein